MTDVLSSGETTRYGFRWGPASFERMAEIEQTNGTYRVVRVKTEAGRDLDIYVSPTGRSVRVFSDGQEWLPPTRRAA